MPVLASLEPTDSTRMSDSTDSTSSVNGRRVIKRYSNRKLYDTKDSRYVTLLEIAEYVRAGEDVQVIDNATKEDKTDVTLALIISEELKARPKGIPLSTLRSLIFEHGERLLNQLREGPIGKLVPWESDTVNESTIAAPEAATTGTEGPDSARKSSPLNGVPTAKAIRATLEQWQQAIDERIRTVIPNFSAISGSREGGPPSAGSRRGPRSEARKSRRAAPGRPLRAAKAAQRRFSIAAEIGPELMLPRTPPPSGLRQSR
ncbi:MAG: polyhydroxyalkanoate synthesis regulator DNA-binding domain-containing protein [Polyangiaceae bacterium]